MSKEKLKIGYSRLTESWYYTGGRTKIDITEEIEAILENRDKTIADLEAKLAEKEKEIENVTIKHLNMLRYFIRHNSKQGIILSSDLEREIEEIEHGGKIWQTKNFNQDKISFCIEQLEKVKEVIQARLVIIEENYTDNLYSRKEYLDMTVENKNILKKIDNQIKQLKGIDNG